MTKIDKISEHFRDYYFLYAIGIIFLVMLRAILGFFAYVSVAPPCWIVLDTSLTNGNEESLRAALDIISADGNSFHLVCDAVDSISEKDCLLADHHIDPANSVSNDPGCFIKGSRTIYLKPDKSADRKTVQKRAAAILKYAKISREYWINFP